MLEKPYIQDELILDCARREYGLDGGRVEFLYLKSNFLPGNTVEVACEGEDGMRNA